MKSLSFNMFKRKKDAERLSLQNRPWNKSMTGVGVEGNKKSVKLAPVTLNVGLMKLVGGKLKRCNGRTMPVKVSSAAGKAVILAAAVRKLANHFTKEVHAELEYNLVYPDGSEVKFFTRNS